MIGDVLWAHEIPGGSVYGPNGLQVIDDIDDDGHHDVVVGTAWAGTGRLGINGSPLQAALIGSSPLGSLGDVDGERTHATIASLERALVSLERAQPRCVDAEIVRRELAQAIRLARHGAWRLLREAGLARPDDAELRCDLEQSIEGQRRCWLERSRPGGLADSLARLEATLASYSPKGR